MRPLALLIGAVITAQGILGLVMPTLFVGIVRYFQTPPIVYAAAVLRVAIGVVLILAAPDSRAALLLRILGGLIVLGGLLTPTLGMAGARVVLESWATGGPAIVRLWAAAAAAIGGVVLYATIPVRRAA